MKFSELPDGRNPSGFKDGLHNPHVEGSGANPPPDYDTTVKADEFIMVGTMQGNVPIMLL